MTKTGLDSIRGRCDRVEDRLVANRAATTARETLRCRSEHRPQHVDGYRWLVADPGAGLEERRPVQRSGGAADCGDQPVPNGAQELAGRGVGRQLAQHLANCSEPDDKVVAVITVPEDCIEAGQVRGVSPDEPLAPAEGGSNGGAIDGVDASRGVGGVSEGGRGRGHGRRV